MQKVKISEVQTRLDWWLEWVSKSQERVAIEGWDGSLVAALVPYEDARLLEEEEDRIDLEEARKALAEGGEPVTLEQLKADLGR
jgi:hypothetical protein